MRLLAHFITFFWKWEVGNAFYKKNCGMGNYVSLRHVPVILNHLIGIWLHRLIQVTVREHLSAYCRRWMIGRSRISQNISRRLLTCRSAVFIDAGNSDYPTSPVASLLETTSKNLWGGAYTINVCPPVNLSNTDTRPRHFEYITSVWCDPRLL